MDKYYTGSVTRVFGERGFFFVTFGERQIFAHVKQWSELAYPKVGDPVTFEVRASRDTRHQWEAFNVKPVTTAPDVQTGASALAATPTTEAR